ncbi:MAG: 3-hydroxyacyl-CoA dehydrogenase/enoyl-CoA hydratase family protein, partial [Flavobacteriales bacterium]|nr:3-hydroxyacyl-CoA dehydrogenase/enoyl-CoA hydratase family protein [Flavobacteriales bacterium]
MEKSLTTKRSINNVAVLGSGVMGSRIACHFANIGVKVLLLDIVPNELDEKEKAAGLTLEDKAVRNRIVDAALKATLKSNPSPIYRKRMVSRITVGNFDDDLERIADCDWVMEVVVERLDIKQQVFEKVEKYRKPGTLITSNTSGIPIHTMLDGRSEDFQKHFCGTHFFNPPRYLKLLEIIPTPQTDQSVIDFLMHYGDLYLGKTTVLCKDTPAFIANRIGVYGIMALFHLVEEMDLTVDEVDKLTGPVLGRPKSATFRTCDVVGLDTLVHVANGLDENCKEDEAHHLFTMPDYIAKMVENNWLGSKSGQGFYKKEKDENGKSTILSLNLKTLEYEPKQRVKFATLEQTKTIDDLKARYKVLLAGKDKAGEFYRKAFYGLFQYVSNRVPEISDDIYKVDDALKAGFAWELGPFEAWDALGVKETLKAMEDEGMKAAQWVYDMVDSGTESFYQLNEGVKNYFDNEKKGYETIPGKDDFIILENVKATKTVWENSGVTLSDIGDGILNIEFHTKMNTIGGDVIQGIHKGIDLAEKDFRGVVVANDGAHFSAGANVGMIFMFAIEQEYDELDMAVRMFQNTTMRLRYSSIPVVVAPHNLTLGGGCEICLHADKVVAHAESYIGLVEFGVGLIPGGGGTKEFAVRFSDELREGDVEINLLLNKFLTIGQAKVSTSAYEAFDLGHLKPGHDTVTVNRDRVIADAKESAIQIAEAGYTQPIQRTDIKVLGKSGMGIVHVGADTMKAGRYISEHDALISE